MKILEIDENTEDTFFRCLHDEKPQNPEITRIRKEWYAKMKTKGLRAKVIIDDNETVVGLCQYLPIEHSPFEGKALMAILCMWIHGYEHLVGNQQSKGYGRLFLEYVERDARESGYKGVAVWGKDFPHWNPVSFYEHMGYIRTDKNGYDVLVWKNWDDSADAPKIRRIPIPKPEEGKVKLTAYLCGWCGDEIDSALNAQKVAKEMEEIACCSIIDISSTPKIGDLLYFDDKPYRPDGPPTESFDEFKSDIIEFHKKKNK